MIITVEMVEKLRNYGNITYEQAKSVLEQTNGDMLDAIILLEQSGKISSPAGGSNNAPKIEFQQKSTVAQKKCGEAFATHIKRFFEWSKKIIHKGNINMLDVTRNNAPVISIPVTVFVIFLLFSFWIIMPIIVISLFFDCRYVFRGPNISNVDINSAANTVAKAANNIKNTVKDVMNDSNQEKNSDS